MHSRCHSGAGLPRWEYDNIIRSLYLLDYVDSPPLRRNVQKALNRGENYHKLRRAVSYANFGKLRFKTEPEQQIWNECARLITNCIIYYNATILSNLLEYKEKNGNIQDVVLLKGVSPVDEDTRLRRRRKPVCLSST